MNTVESTPYIKKIREKLHLNRENLIPSLEMIKKTFLFDLCSVKRFVISIFIMVLVPALVIVFVPSYNLHSGASIVRLLGFLTWYYNFSIVFPIIIIGSTSPLISEELRSGTLLFLVSKPINRPRIIMSKFIALFLFGVLISFISLCTISLVALIKYPFVDIGSYLGIYFLYSLIVLFFFGDMTMGFSSIFRRARNVLLIPLMLVIFSFLVIMGFKPLLLMTEDNWYEKYLLYNFDIGYQFANIFIWIGEFFIPNMIDYYGEIFYMFGLTKWEYNPTEHSVTIIKTEYYHPVGSIFYFIIIGGIFLVIGILYLKKRDIS